MKNPNKEKTESVMQRIFREMEKRRYQDIIKQPPRCNCVACRQVRQIEALKSTVAGRYR